LFDVARQGAEDNSGPRPRCLRVRLCSPLGIAYRTR
jgi:hypothetical protein